MKNSAPIEPHCLSSVAVARRATIPLPGSRRMLGGGVSGSCHRLDGGAFFPHLEGDLCKVIISASQAEGLPAP
jgi:hypothetical protein